MLELSQEK
jgi:hypothetical protein